MSKFNEFNHTYSQATNMSTRGHYCHFDIGLPKESPLSVVAAIFRLGLHGSIKVHILMY